MDIPKTVQNIGTARKLDTDSELRRLLSAIIRACPHKKRQQICKELSVEVGQDITVHMLNDWTSEAKKPARFPAALVPALCKITSDDRLQRFLLSERLLALLRIGERVIESDAQLKSAEQELRKLIDKESHRRTKR